MNRFSPPALFCLALLFSIKLFAAGLNITFDQSVSVSSSTHSHNFFTDTIELEEGEGEDFKELVITTSESQFSGYQVGEEHNFSGAAVNTGMEHLWLQLQASDHGLISGVAFFVFSHPSPDYSLMVLPDGCEFANHPQLLTCPIHSEALEFAFPDDLSLDFSQSGLLLDSGYMLTFKPPLDDTNRKPSGKTEKLGGKQEGTSFGQLILINSRKAFSQKSETWSPTPAIFGGEILSGLHSMGIEDLFVRPIESDDSKGLPHQLTHTIIQLYPVTIPEPPGGGDDDPEKNPFFSGFKQPCDERGCEPVDEASESNSKARIKRPMNSFIVYSSGMRKKLKEDNPSLTQGDMSKWLSKEWRAMSENQKKPYIDAANELAERHHQDYPNYRFQPRKRKKTKGLRGHLETPAPTATPSHQSQSQPGIPSTGPAGQPITYFLVPATTAQPSSHLSQSQPGIPSTGPAGQPITYFLVPATTAQPSSHLSQSQPGISLAGAGGQPIPHLIPAAPPAPLSNVYQPQQGNSLAGICGQLTPLTIMTPAVMPPEKNSDDAPTGSVNMPESE